MNSKVEKIGFFLLLVLAVIFIWKFAIPYAKNLTDDRLKKRIDIEALSNNPNPVTAEVGAKVITFEIAANEAERAQGLSERLYLDDDAGMLFVFDKAGYHSIWMKDMVFSIDIAWLDRNFKILDIKPDVSPDTYPESFQPSVPARYVLEVNAGFFESNNIGVGSTLHLVEDEFSL